MNEHERYMRRAIALAGKVSDLPFGAVIVDRDTGTILSEGWNKTSINPTWHAEIDAINGLASSGVAFEGKNLVLFTTAEPCPMCQGAVLWAGIKTVVLGTSIRSLQRTDCVRHARRRSHREHDRRRSEMRSAFSPPQACPSRQSALHEALR